MPKPAGSNSRFLKRRFKGMNAFTVVEILTFIVISAIMVTVLWRLFSNTFTSVKAGTEHIHITRYFRLAMMYLKDDLDNAISIDILGNNGEKLEITRLSNIDAGGGASFSEVAYWNESGNIKRKENGAATIIGDNKQVEINFGVRKTFIDGPDYSKYEVSIMLSGKNLKNENEVDSIEVLVAPQMMIKNKSITWMPNPEATH